MLLRLPTELLHVILYKVDKRDQKVLCEVSKDLCKIVLPFLYEKITICLDEEFRFPTRFHCFLKYSRRHSSLVKELAFEAPFRNNLTERCPHNILWPEPEDDSDEEMYDVEDDNNMLEVISSQLMLFLECFADNTIRSFSWNLGTCIPEAILGESGCLVRSQRHLTALSLITDGSCSYNMDGECPLDLSGFHHLSSFSWMGLRSVEDFEALRDCLEENSSRLERLTIDVIKWTEANDSWFTDHGRGNASRSHSFLAEDILGLKPDGSKLTLLSLRHLVLSAISFQPMTKELMKAFNFSALRSLKLWNCPGAYELLKDFAESDLEIELTSFEFVDDADGNCDDIDIYLVDFLNAFAGLKDLYLLVRGPANWHYIGLGIISHKSSLTRLVIHDRTTDITVGSSRFEEVCDGNVSWHPPIAFVISKLGLDCLGISNDCDFLTQNLRSLKSKPQCRLLHVRSSRRNDEVMPDEDLYGTPSNGNPSMDPDNFDLYDFGLDGSSNSYASNSASSGGSCSDNCVSDDNPPLRKEPTESHEEVSFEPPLPMPESQGPFAGVSRDLLQLAQWAFSPDGLPNLQIIAYGDFSYDGRYIQYTELFCRDQPIPQKNKSSESTTPVQSNWTFRRLTKDDVNLQDLIKDNFDMLGACAVDSIMAVY